MNLQSLRKIYSRNIRCFIIDILLGEFGFTLFNGSAAIPFLINDREQLADSSNIFTIFLRIASLQVSEFEPSKSLLPVKITSIIIIQLLQKTVGRVEEVCQVNQAQDTQASNRAISAIPSTPFMTDREVIISGSHL